jgi:phage terminase large subunit GpA-like protein
MVSPAALALFRSSVAGLRPPDELGFVDWLEREVVLPSDVAAQPGRLRLSAPQRGVAEALDDPEFERVSIMKSARVGASTLLISLVGYWATRDPGPIGYLQPRDSDARDFMTSEFEAVMDASPCLKDVFRYEASGRNWRRGNMTTRFFPGGSLRTLAARSPRNLRRITLRYLIADETEGYESDPKEGNTVLLAERRTLSFSNRRIVQASTPKLDAPSFIGDAFAAGDRRLYHVCCVSCGRLTPIAWKDIEWPPDRPEEAYFRCPRCGERVEERHKRQMVESGAWIAMRPEVRGHASFHWTSLTSLLPKASWGVLAAEFLAAKDDPTKLQTFVNLVLGEPWRAAGDELEDAALISRREPFSLDRLPLEVLAITAGCDVQADRVEIVFVGHDRGSTAYILAHQIAWGPTTEDGVWQDLDELLKAQWRHPGGGLIGVDAAAIDAGDGGMFDRVMKFCAARASRRVWAIKGAAGFSRPAFQQSFSTKKSGQRLYIVGVDALKLQLHERLKRGSTVRFSETLELVFFEQLTAERLVTRMSRGRPVRRFEAIPGRRSEALDGTIYALAARAGLALNLDAREASLKGEPQSAPKAPAVTRSRWMDGL